MDDLEPFESARLMLNGAKECTDDFEVACKVFTDGCRYDAVSHIDPNTKEKVIKFRFSQRIPGMIRQRATGIVTDLRHALDHAMCDSAALLGVANLNRIYFPFGKSLCDFESEVRRKCRGFPTELITFIKSLQPYYDGDALLYLISSLSGKGKHQRVLRISYGDEGAKMHVEEGRSVKGPVKLFINKWSELRNELEFARIGQGGYIDMNFSLSLKVVIGAGEPPLDGPAASVFRRMAGKVDSIILGLETETSRLLAHRPPTSD